MPTPHACWVILIGAVPTSFRAKTREELLPTYRQLQRTQPGVALRWFERGRIWESPAAARGAALLAAAETREKRRSRPPSGEPKRGKDWRPGGDHKDPKARFELTRDQKRAKFKRNLIRKSAGTAGPGGTERPPDDPFSAGSSAPPRRPPARGADRGPRRGPGPGGRNR
jgi:hypothetical protein